MDENLERLNRIYPNSGFVLIQGYDESQWEGREYDSSFDHKAALNKWKSKALTYDEAQDALTKGYRIGWIVPRGYVIVDIDNKDDERAQEYIEKILEKFEVKYSYNYTSKGCHILFRDPSESIKSDSRMKCSLNISIDTRANTTGYIVLPSNDPHRAWGQWNDFVEEIPYFLKPVTRNMTPSFIGMVDGDGRNDALWRWRSVLEQSKFLTEEEVEKSIRIINENLFETPIVNTELFKTVLRKKDKKADKILEDKENIFNKYADEIIGKYDVVAHAGQIYLYNGTYYKEVQEIDIEKIIHYELSKNISKTGRKEIIDFLRVKTNRSIEEFNKYWHKIACKNGVINLVTGELETPNKTEINTIYLPYNYTTDPVYSPRVDEFMNDLTAGDVQKKFFLYQIAGYCLLKKNIFEKFVICRGGGGTGKSTYVNLLARMVGGDRNCSHVSLADFDKDYYLSSLANKLLNIDDDVVDTKALESTGRFKSIVSGNIISVRRIYQDVSLLEPFVTCVFCCNKMPKIMDKTSGLYRRMILLELDNKVEHPDPQFLSKITDTDMEYMLYKAVQAIKVAIEEGRFRVTQSEQELLHVFRRKQSAVNEWLHECGFTTGDLVGANANVLYKQFKQWCEDNGYTKICTSYSFKDDICALYDMELVLKSDEEGKVPTQRFNKRGNYDKEFKPF